jgi:hypothetical protein
MPYLGKQPSRTAFDASDIPDDSITAAKIVDGAITIADIADDAVTEDKLANAINTAIAANTAKVTNATHTGEVTGSGALTITADAVTGAKIADDAIDSEHYTDGSIDTAHIANDQITNALMADDAIDSAQIAAGAIDDAHFASGTIVGKQTIWIPANAMTPTASNGCAALATVETTAGRPDLQVLDFDDGSDEHAQFTVAFPKSWNAGTITYQVFWTSTATDTDGVAWALQGVSFADNDSIDTFYGTAIVVTDNAQGAIEELYLTAESSAVTIQGSPGDNELVWFRIFRDVSDGNDDMAEDARLLGVKLFFTTDALNDA